MKKVMSSDGVVVMDREGGSQLWPVNGTEVSTVIGVSSVEKRRRVRVGVVVRVVVRGLRREVVVRRVRDMIVADRWIEQVV